MLQLLETMGPFNRGGTRHYINGKRVTEHEFCQVLLKHRGGDNATPAAVIQKRMQPDFVRHGFNRHKETTTRRYWNIEDKPPSHPLTDEYEKYFDERERANKIPLSFEDWCNQLKGE